MRTSHSRRALVSLSACVLLAAACAHAPVPSTESRKAARADKVFVTGSHIAQRVDPASGEPQTISSLRVYSRDQLLGTGRPGDLRQALRTLDPSLAP